MTVVLQLCLLDLVIAHETEFFSGNGQMIFKKGKKVNNKTNKQTKTITVTYKNSQNIFSDSNETSCCLLCC